MGDGVPNCLIKCGRNPAVTSTITLLELLVPPYREEKEDLVHKIFAMMSTFPNLSWVPVTMEIADKGAQLRARYRLSTPDAIQLSTAMKNNASRFYGNDRGLRKVQEIECVILDDFL